MALLPSSDASLSTPSAVRITVPPSVTVETLVPVPELPQTVPEPVVEEIPPLPEPEPERAPEPVYVAPQWPASLEPCGGDLPPCYVKQRESHGDYSAKNPYSSASGAWQFLDTTFAGAVTTAGYPEWAGQPARNAPPEIQDAAARALWDGGRGCGHWSAC